MKLEARLRALPRLLGKGRSRRPPPSCASASRRSQSTSPSWSTHWDSNWLSGCGGTARSRVLVISSRTTYFGPRPCWCRQPRRRPVPQERHWFGGGRGLVAHRHLFVARDHRRIPTFSSRCARHLAGGNSRAGSRAASVSSRRARFCSRSRRGARDRNRAPVGIRGRHRRQTRTGTATAIAR